MTVCFDWPDPPTTPSPRAPGSQVDGEAPAAVSQGQVAPSVVTVGVFDGFHRGHQALLRTAAGEGRRLGLPTTLVTFDPHPLRVLCPERAPRQLLPLAARIEYARALGANRVVVLAFNEQTAHMSAEDFVDAGLVGRLGMRSLVVGENFACGAGGRGDLDFLRHRGSRLGYEVVAVPMVRQAGIACSSSEIRRRLADGDLDSVTQLLGRADSRILSPPDSPTAAP